MSKMGRKTFKYALTGGIAWGMCMFITTLLAVYTGYGKAFLEVIKSMYPGYSLTIRGSITGLLYGFLDVFIGVYIVTWLYKKIHK